MTGHRVTVSRGEGTLAPTASRAKLAAAPAPRGLAKRTPNPKLRVLWLAAILVAWCFLIAGRLTQLQIIEYGDFTQRAARQQRRTIDVSPRRGVIYDRNGHELAMTVSVDSVFSVPSDMPDPAMAAGLLGRVLGVPAKEMLAKLDAADRK